MTPAQILADAAEAIYGRHWKRPLAADLGVEVKTVYRWLRGEHGIGDWPAVRAILLKKLETKIARAQLAWGHLDHRR